MSLIRPLAVVLFALAAASPLQAAMSLDAAVASPERTPEFVLRDRYRHPVETLRFFGIEPDMTVVEIWPGGGWYTEILAPYLRDSGHFYAATPAASLPAASAGLKKSVADFKARLATKPALYGKVTFTEFHPPERNEIAPPGSADMVLTFRNVHNWIGGGFEADAFKAFYAALKPGGVLGVVEHRAPVGTDLAGTKRSGYTTEAYVKSLAKAAGFEFVAGSDINDNPKDSKDYSQGVWTLPPSLRLRDVDRDKYLAIGESDRMTLKFLKPKAN